MGGGFIKLQVGVSIASSYYTGGIIFITGSGLTVRRATHTFTVLRRHSKNSFANTPDIKRDHASLPSRACPRECAHACLLGIAVKLPRSISPISPAREFVSRTKTTREGGGKGRRRE